MPTKSKKKPTVSKLKKKLYGQEYYRKNRVALLAKNKAYFEKNREKVSSRQKEYYKKRRENDPSYILKTRIWSKKAYVERREDMLVWQKQYWERNRKDLLEYLGKSRCVRCGYDDDWRALQIDHVDGGGRKDKVSKLKPHLFIEHLKKNPEEKKKYQVLCANCNFIKRHENKETRGRRSIEEIEKEIKKLEENLDAL